MEIGTHKHRDIGKVRESTLVQEEQAFGTWVFLVEETQPLNPGTCHS